MTVHIVRDAEERYIQGVYYTYAAAAQEIRSRVGEMTDEPEGSEEWDYMWDQYEILAMTVEGIPPGFTWGTPIDASAT